MKEVKILSYKMKKIIEKTKEERLKWAMDLFLAGSLFRKILIKYEDEEEEFLGDDGSTVLHIKQHVERNFKIPQKDVLIFFGKKEILKDDSLIFDELERRNWRQPLVPILQIKKKTKKEKK